MALVTLLAVAAWAVGRAWARPLMPFALGMLSYATVSSLSWAIHNDLATAVPMLATLMLPAFTSATLIGAGALGHRHRSACA